LLVGTLLEGVDAMANKRSSKMSKMRWIRRAIFFVLVGAAVITELRKPKEERSWHGKLAGFVPYELRKPTVQRVRDTYWAPSDEHVLKPVVWGVGWALNVGRVVKLVRRERVEAPPIAA
jgi:hypothetical protein